jgi:CBS-domain-containing membrane protein
MSTRQPLFDAKIHRNLKRYLLQVSIATLALFAALLAEEIMAGGAAARAVVVAAIASTAFVLFISPFSDSADPRHAIGGHLIAVLVTGPLAVMAETSVGVNWIAGIPAIFALYAALGVGVTMFLMAATNTEHPPAAGTALAIVAHGFSWDLVLFIGTAVLILVAIQRASRSRLIDLY